MASDRINFRLNPEHREALERIAEQQGRSLSNLVNFALREFVLKRQTKFTKQRLASASENQEQQQRAS